MTDNNSNTEAERLKKTSEKLIEEFNSANAAAKANIRVLTGLALVVRNKDIADDIRIDMVKNLILSFGATMQFVALELLLDSQEQFPEVPTPVLMSMMAKNFERQEKKGNAALVNLFSLLPEFEGVDIQAEMKKTQEEERLKAARAQGRRS